ncbi:MAG: hypothetical protein M1822_001115 [Bathelium mastoideum]|nr:MAG: hypothetical protein M1822_001115 [Bathelium mastoideum]
MTRGIECHYPTNASKDTGPRIQRNDDADELIETREMQLVADPPDIENRQVAENDGHGIPDSALFMSDLEFASLGDECLDWNEPNLAFANFLNPQTYNETVHCPSPRSPPLTRHSRPSADQAVQARQAVSSSNVSIPTSPSHTIRSLVKRPRMQTGAQRIANLVLHTLKSYPLMMMRHNTLPPFIHPCLTSSDVEDIRMEPLINCISLMHMIGSGVQRSRKLFWKNVRMECERLRAEYKKLHKWELLAAMQALSIYILVRLDEGETDHNNFDFLLLTTVMVIAKQFTYGDIPSDTQSAPCTSDLERNWKDWMFEESRRRICVVYRVVNLLMYFEPAAMCNLQTGLVMAPLPARKHLWEASDEYVWKTESDREPGAKTAFGMATNGDLVKVDEGQIYCTDAELLHPPLDTGVPTRDTANWEEWCSGMDGFGGLVMLAASLIV